MNFKLIGFLRFIFFGLLAFKYIQIFSSTIILTDYIINTSVLLLIIFSIFSAIGLFTPFSILFLILFSSFIEKRIHTYSIANLIIVLNSILFLVLGSWRLYSIDKLFKKSFFLPSKELILYALRFTIIAYGISNFGAMVYHLNDITWIKGLTFKSILLNPYLSNYSSFFEGFNNSILNLISYSAFIFQTFYQIFLIPLFFINRHTKKFVKIYGFFFFACSLIFLNLSFLPHFEIILWILIFYPNKPKNKIHIFYDERCNLCKRTMFFFKIIDVNEKIFFVPSAKINKYYKEKVELTELKNQIYIQYKGRTYKGFDSYFLLSKKIPLIIFLSPLFYFLKISKIGYEIYNFISINRIKFFGTCEISYDDKLSSLLSNEKINNINSSFYKKILIFFSFVVFLNLAIKIPHDNFGFLKSETKYSPINLLTYGIESLGFDIPNVFNDKDLLMGKYFFNIYYNGNLISLINEKGERINQYGNVLKLSNHNSDYLYFQNSLRLKRYLIQKHPKEFLEDPFIRNQLFEIIKFFKAKNKIKNGNFIIKLFENNIDLISKDPFKSSKQLLSQKIIEL